MAALYDVLTTYRTFGHDFIVARTILDTVRIVGGAVVGRGPGSSGTEVTGGGA